MMTPDRQPKIELGPGAELGPYRIEAPLGSGGMGEVYRGTDPRLRRAVAIKVSFARFNERTVREARVVAALNHPNICQIYDVGPDYLVMELVEGPTLAERLRRGPMPLDEALAIARQIANALEAAHEKGIVHRDLKPANIKVRPDGTVKVLDFGLAKATEGAHEGAPEAGNPENSPTVTVEQETRPGTVLGTAAYMAPEQARGQVVDKRADIWAFGVVLYEMLAGRRLFTGDTVTDILAAVLTLEPEWNHVPQTARRLLRLCLEREPRQRLRDIGDARFLLDEGARTAVAPPARNGQWKAATVVLAIAMAAAMASFWLYTRRAVPAVMRLSVDLGRDAALAPLESASMALSPDGSRIAFVVGPPQSSQLALRRLDQSGATLLAGTDGARSPFFSPDGKSIAFFADGKLKKMDAGGGPAVTLCDAPSPREGSWGEDDAIVFAPGNTSGLWRVPSSGGAPTEVTKVDAQKREYSHRYPQALPGGHEVLFTNSPDPAGEGPIEVVSVQTGKRKTLVQAGGYGHYLARGYLIYMHRGTLWAAPLSPGRMEVTGPAVPVLEDVSFHITSGAAGFTFSQTGMFVYIASSPEDRKRPISVMDEKGNVEPLPIPKGAYSRPRISPDGSRLAVAAKEGAATHIWIYEWATRRFTRLPFDAGNSAFPVWTPDGQYLAFSTDSQTPGPGIYWIRADGGGAAQRLVEGQNMVPASFSPTKPQLLYEARGAVGHGGLWIVPLDWRDPAHPRPGVAERVSQPDVESPAEFSPDGRWIVYGSGRLGRPEVFVVPSSGAGGPWQLSAGGITAAWSRDGRQLFYQGVPEINIKVADYSSAGDSFSAASPRSWSEMRVKSFDLMPDGKRVVMVPDADQKEATHAVFILNFTDTLRQRMSSGK